MEPASTRLLKPTMKKVPFQVKRTTSHAMRGAPRASPARVPQFINPEASPWSRGLKNTFTIFMPAGKYTDSPIPSRMRNRMRIERLPTNPVAPQASDQTANAPAYSQRRLKRSEDQPIGNCINAYDQKNAERSTPFEAGPRCKSIAISGRATDRMARSR